MTLAELVWLSTPLVVSLVALICTIRAHRIRMTFEDQEYLRAIIRKELNDMQIKSKMETLLNGAANKRPEPAQARPQKEAINALSVERFR